MLAMLSVVKYGVVSNAGDIPIIWLKGKNIIHVFENVFLIMAAFLSHIWHMVNKSYNLELISVNR